MDPITAIGTAASIVQLVQVGAQLSIQFYTIGKQIKNAPKIFEEISNEVASTSTILQLLSSELDDQNRLKLHKPAAVQKTKELMAECSAIYDVLDQKITPNVKDGASDRAKARAALMKRLKMPYMADEFSELRNKLTGVKTWLNMMLSTLNLGVQAKGFSGSQEAKELLLEQRQMLEMLVQETRLLREKAGQSGVSSGKPDPAWPGTKVDKDLQTPVMPFVNASTTSLPDSMLTLVDTDAAKGEGHKTSNSIASNHATGQSDVNAPVTNNAKPATISTSFNGLPEELTFYAREIREQARLITDLVELIDQKSYAISKRTRSSMHEQTLNTHLVQWRKMAQKHGYKYLISMVEEFPDLLENWSAKMFEAEEKIVIDKIEPTIQISRHGRADSPTPLSISTREKILKSSDEQVTDSDKVSKLLNKDEAASMNKEEEFRRKVSEGFSMKAGHSSDYIEDILENKTASRAKSRRSKANQFTLDSSRPTYVRIQEKHILPETLDYYGLPWEYDEKDHRYIIIKQYIDHELQQELFRHTVRIYERRQMSVIASGSEEGFEKTTTTTTTTTTKPRMDPMPGNDNMRLVLGRWRDRFAAKDLLTGEDSVSAQPASVEEKVWKTVEDKIAEKEVRKLSDEQIAEFEEAFKLFDKNGDGFLSKAELGTIHRALGQNPTTEEFDKSLKRAKVEDPEKISFEDFLRMMEYQLPDELGEIDETMACLRVFDKDNQGSITANEVRMVMKSLGEEVTDEEIDEVVRRQVRFERSHSRPAREKSSTASSPPVMVESQRESRMSRRQSRRTSRFSRREEPPPEPETVIVENEPSEHISEAPEVVAEEEEEEEEDIVEVIEEHSPEPPPRRRKSGHIRITDPASFREADHSGGTIDYEEFAQLISRQDSPAKDEEDETTTNVLKDVENLLREYTLLDEDELKMLQT